MALDQIVRCSDGHLYTMSAASRLFAVHLGTRRRLQRCAVDHRWRIAENVNPSELSEAELEEARKHRA